MRFELARKIEEALSERISTVAYCKLVNLRNSVRGKQHRLVTAVGEDPSIHIASDGVDSIHICRRGRHNRYKRGLMAGVDRLAQAYSLDLIEDLRDGVFIDCGANVGELGFWARKRGFNYIPFEPEVLESRCVDLNHFDGEARCVRMALWNEESVLKFYTRADSADSSLLAGAGEEAAVTVNATKLDTALDLSEATGPVIFKVEAEGAEPEVLAHIPQVRR
jgi:FkbM family methyltransferase